MKKIILTLLMLLSVTMVFGKTNYLELQDAEKILKPYPKKLPLELRAEHKYSSIDYIRGWLSGDLYDSKTFKKISKIKKNHRIITTLDGKKYTGVGLIYNKKGEFKAIYNFKNGEVLSRIAPLANEHFLKEKVYPDFKDYTKVLPEKYRKSHRMKDYTSDTLEVLNYEAIDEKLIVTLNGKPYTGKAIQYYDDKYNYKTFWIKTYKNGLIKKEITLDPEGVVQEVFFYDEYKGRPKRTGYIHLIYEYKTNEKIAMEVERDTVRMIPFDDGNQYPNRLAVKYRKNKNDTRYDSKTMGKLEREMFDGKFLLTLNGKKFTGTALEFSGSPEYHIWYTLYVYSDGIKSGEIYSEVAKSNMNKVKWKENSRRYGYQMGSIKLGETLKYDIKGRIQRIQYYDKNKRLIKNHFFFRGNDYRIFSFRENGTRRKDVGYYSNGFKMIDHSYDENGSPEKYTYYRYNGNLERILYSKTSKEKIDGLGLKAKYFNEDGELIGYKLEGSIFKPIIEYYSNGNKKKEHVFDRKKHLKTVYYWENGNKKREVVSVENYSNGIDFKRLSIDISGKDVNKLDLDALYFKSPALIEENYNESGILTKSFFENGLVVEEQPPIRIYEENGKTVTESLPSTSYYQ